MLGASHRVDVAAAPHCTALGKVLYAHGVLALPAGALERRTAHSPLDRALLERELAQVRHRGWASSIDELEVGLAAVAAPIRAVDGAVVGAVSVSGPTARIADRGITALAELLLAEVRGLSQVGHPVG